MDTSKKLSPFQETLSLIKLLLVAALCSQHIVLGTALLFIGSSSSSSLLFERSSGNPILLVSGFVIYLGVPLLFGLYLTLSWRGLKSGFAGIVSLMATYVISTVLSRFRFPDSFYSALTSGLIVGSILVFSGKVKTRRERIGLVIGLVVGIALSFFPSTAIALPKDALYIPFVWTWLSVVFFPELLGGRAGWRGTLVWAAMMVLSPFLIGAVIQAMFG